MKAVARAIDAAMKEAGTAARAAQEKRYLKSELVHYGCGMPAVRAAVRAHVPRGIAHDDLIALVEALWGATVYERRAAAAVALERAEKVLVAADLPLLERLLRESRTWALVDLMAIYAVGSLVACEPACGRVLDRWARDPDFWLRRAALLALLLPLRRGEGDFARFSRYADALLADKEFFIRKAIGWILREVSRKRPQLVTDWLAPRAHLASSLTRREATKYLSGPQLVAIDRAMNASLTAN